jgi:hypothetical protein
VSGLPPEAFGVVEDGRAQTVRFFADTDTPVTVGLLVDSSASMHPNRRVVIAGATSFAEASSPRDEIFALAFNEDVYSALPPAAPFTNDSTVLRAALEHYVTARGRTALYDAISTGVDYFARGTPERKVLVVLSDGGDNASHATKEASVRKALASNAVIYTIALVLPGVHDANPALLKELAQASGSESFRPDTNAPSKSRKRWARSPETSATPTRLATRRRIQRATVPSGVFASWCSHLPDGRLQSEAGPVTWLELQRPNREPHHPTLARSTAGRRRCHRLDVGGCQSAGDDVESTSV